MHLLKLTQEKQKSVMKRNDKQPTENHVNCRKSEIRQVEALRETLQTLKPAIQIISAGREPLQPSLPAAELGSWGASQPPSRPVAELASGWSRSVSRRETTSFYVHI